MSTFKVKEHMTRLNTYTATALLLLAAAALTPAAAQEPPPPAVGVVTVTPQEITITQDLNGRVAPSLIAEVRPQVNGIILRRLFEEGSDVTENMPLYQIDPAMYEAQLASAKAQLAKAEASAEAAEAKLTRYKSLLTARAVNRQEYDEVEAATKQARAEVGLAEAQVRIAQINVNYASVLSPISGRIGKSSVTQGALVTASQPDPLAVVQKLDPVYVDVTQPVSAMLALQDGIQAGILENTGESHAEMRLVLDDGREYAHKGKLLFADVTVDQTTGTISLRAEFPNPENVLLPGMFVSALLDVAHIPDAVTVSQAAVRRNPDGTAYVLLVGEGNRVERRAVKPLRTYGNDWLIGDGLAAGDTVIVEGTQRVSFVPGQPGPVVTPQPITANR